MILRCRCIGDVDGAYFAVNPREDKDIMISNNIFNQHENVLPEARFELTPSGFRSAALPIELFSPTGIGGEFYLYLQGTCTKYFRDNLTLIHERMYSVSILYQNHPQRNYMSIEYKYIMISNTVFKKS